MKTKKDEFDAIVDELRGFDYYTGCQSIADDLENWYRKYATELDVTNSHYCEYATAGNGCVADKRLWQRNDVLLKENSEFKMIALGLKRLLRPVLECEFEESEIKASNVHTLEGSDEMTATIKLSVWRDACKAAAVIRDVHRKFMSADALYKDERGQSPR